MKKQMNQWRLGIPLLKYDLKMKLTTLFLITTLFGLHANNGNGQNTKVSLDMENTTIGEIINKIESSTELRFIYKTKDVNLERKMSLNVKSEQIETVLNAMFQSTITVYRIRGNHIVLRQGNKEKSLIKNVPKENLIHKPQDQTITGTITDGDGTPLLGANILEKGTTNGVQTDFDGNFSIEVSDENAILVVSYLGFSNKEVPIDRQSNISIVLQESAAGLDEVVVVGYGTQAKKDVTGSISSISSEEIERRPVASVDDALQGLAAGLSVANRSSAPGQLSRITIRAVGSLSAGFEPLWVIDGFPTDQRNAQAINPADIESVEILKDASSTAIYGSRGANGVIIITTKSGKKGTSNINIAVTSGISTNPQSQRFEMLNAQEYVQYHTEINGGTVPDFIANNWDGVTNTNWQEELFVSAPFQDYSLSASGGSEKVSYLLSGNYTDQTGVIKGEGFDKYTARIKMEYKPNDKITIGLNLAPNYSIITTPYNGDTGSGGAYQQALLMPPIIPVRRNDGSFAQGADIPGLRPVGNPLETIQNYKSTQDIFRFLGGISLAFEPIDGLVLKTTASANIGYDSFETIYNAPNDGLLRQSYSNVSSLSLRKTQQIGWLNENTVNYKKVIGDHAFDILGGFTLQKDQFEALQSNVDNLQVQGPTILSLGDASTLTSSNQVTESTLVSYLGRLNYSYKDRYLVTGTIRNDGSSRFGINNRSQTFSSFALGWRLSEENFIKNLDFVDNAKLRVSFGNTGSNSIPNFISKPSLAPINHAFGGSTVTGIYIESPGNTNLTWETSEQLDIGFDLSLFGGRFDMVLDYYNNETTSLLLSRNLVPSSGYSGFLTNIGSMRNRGVELAVNVAVVDNEDFSWSVGGNVTNNDQEILDLGGDEEIRNFFGALRRVVGKELQTIHVTETAGIYREGQTLPEGQETATLNPQGGEFIYTDVDGDGQISNFLGSDGQLLNGTNIKWNYGFNTNLRYKNFDLTALFVGQAGAHVLDLWSTQNAAPGSPINGNMPREFYYEGRYISEDQPGDGRTPRAGAFNDGIATVASFGIQKTDYLRFKNITLSYKFPSNLIEKIGLSNATLFTSIENVWTWSDFIGGNTDARSGSGGGPSLFGGSRIPGVSDDLEYGLTYATLPALPRTFTLGLNFSF
jgi:TonB-linked SusC/RagA family outer membrane protein